MTLKDDLAQLPIDRLQRLANPDLAQVAERIHRLATQLLASHERAAELDNSFRLSRAELEAGRGVDAVLDLVRAQEKIVSASLGPNQSKSYLDRVGQLLATV